MSTVQVPGQDKPTSTVAVIDGETGILGAIPQDLLTDGGDGPNRRVRVDVGQTGFFAGREFRTFKELNIPASSTYVVKIVVPIDIILFGLGAIIEAGHLRIASVVEGTEGGSFSEVLPIFARNTMSERPIPLYTPQVVITAGGTHTGGTELDVFRLQASGNPNQASSVGAAGNDERGIGANTYYLRLQNLSAQDAITGVFSARWEERLP